MDRAVRHITTPTGVNEGLVGKAKVLVVLKKGEEVVVAVGGKVGGVQVREQLFWIRQFRKQLCTKGRKNQKHHFFCSFFQGSQIYLFE